jgi:hypothetical protein
MVHYAKKLAAVGFLVFLAIWIGGIARTYTMAKPDPAADAFAAPILSSPSYGDEASSGRNVTNNLKQIGIALPQVLDRQDINEVEIYAKTAHLASGSSTFADDVERTRKVIADNKAAIFNETASGIAPHRVLSFGIGVHPDRFIALIDQLTGIGQIESINVGQQDLTGEFRRLHAQRQSLMKHQAFILKLRDTDKLSVEEALKLEQKALEVEKEIQLVSAQLGDLATKEPTCNVFMTLQEFQPGSWNDRGFTVSRRLRSGFIWALGWWFLTALGIGCLVGTLVSVKTLRSSPRTQLQP